jgi:hypothetical protein
VSTFAVILVFVADFLKYRKKESLKNAQNDIIENVAGLV